MPTVARSRSIPVPAERVWQLIADPHNLPRWWPETVRVESVEGAPGARRSRFTQVLGTKKGSSVRADFRCIESTQGRRLVWQQQVEGTPFEKFLRGSELEFTVEADGAKDTRITIEGRRALRGLSRLGGPMMSGATKRVLDGALAGIQAALCGNGATA